MSDSNGQLKNAAIRYAELGYSVFPCAPGRKVPLTEKGFHDATGDIERIEAWWESSPKANIGICTEGLLVIDIDGSENAWLQNDQEKSGALAVGPLSLTPHGGRHHLFRQPDGKAWRCTAGKLAHKVDTRANGGYLVLAPSVVDGKPYEWAEGFELDVSPDRLLEPPDWLIELLDACASREGPCVPQAENNLLDGNPIPEGQRNATLAKLAGAMRRVGMGQAEILAAILQVNQDRCRPPLPKDEVRKIAASIAQYEPDQISVAVAENHWEQDQKLARGAGLVDPGPFPEKLLEVPGFIGEVVAYNLETAFKPQPVLGLGAALALLGTLTGRKITDAHGTRTNVYCLGVCESGGGKERNRQVNKDILYKAGLPEMIGPEGLASHAGLINAVEIQPAILFQLDEIGRLLRTLGDAGRSPHLYHIATVLMKLFTSSGSIYIGDAYADTKRNKRIYQPHACLYGTTVPRSLYEGLTAESISDGFLSRMLIFETDDHDPDPQQPVTREMPESILTVAHYWGNFDSGGNLSDQVPQPLVIDYTEEAQEAMSALEDHAREERWKADKNVATLWTRTTEKARKLAIIYACSENHKAPIVSHGAATWAAELSEYLTRKMIRIAADWISETPFEARRKRVLREIRNAPSGRMGREELCRRIRSIKSKEREEVITSLHEAGEIRILKEATAGAPRLIYEVS